MTVSNYVIHWSSERWLGQQFLRTTEAVLVRHIAGGQVDGQIDHIDQYDIEEGWSRDVTEDIAIALGNHLDPVEPITDTLYEFIETHRPALARCFTRRDKTFAVA